MLACLWKYTSTCQLAEKKQHDTCIKNWLWREKAPGVIGYLWRRSDVSNLMTFKTMSAMAHKDYYCSKKFITGKICGPKRDLRPYVHDFFQSALEVGVWAGGGCPGWRWVCGLEVATGAYNTSTSNFKFRCSIFGQ